MPSFLSRSNTSSPNWAQPWSHELLMCFSFVSFLGYPVIRGAVWSEVDALLAFQEAGGGLAAGESRNYGQPTNTMTLY